MNINENIKVWIEPQSSEEEPYSVSDAVEKVFFFLMLVLKNISQLLEEFRRM